MNDVFVNHRIRAKNVRVVDEDGNQIGVVELRVALTHAANLGLDLIQINTGEVPVCRLGDAGKFIFDKKKNQRESARRQRELQVETKEIQLRPVTDTNDLQVKARRASEFLAAGDKVKVVVRFRGRERAHKEQGRYIIEELLSHVGDYRIAAPVADTGRDLSITISPTKSKSDLLREKLK